MELGDDDLVVVEEDIPVVIDDEIEASPRDADLAKTRRRTTIPPPSMRPLDGRVEDDVAGQCLASIAAEVRAPQSASGIRAIVAAAPVVKTPDRELGAAPRTGSSYTIPPAARLPRVTSPPFVRAQAAPGMRASTPPSAFARRSSSQLRAADPIANVVSATVEIPTVKGASTNARSETPPPAVSSVVPVAIPSEARAVEPTVIVLRERPKVGWIVASAAIGALCALAAAKLVTSPSEAPAAAAQSTSTTTIATAVMNGPAPAAPLPPAAAATAISPSPMLAHPAPVVAPAPASTGAVVRFGDEQGVAIAAPKPTTATTVAPASKPAAAPATRPAAPAKGSKPVKAPMTPLPDGSFPLGHGESKSAAAPVSAPPPVNTPTQAERAAQAALASTILPSANGANGSAPAAAPEPPPPPRRRSLTPEQQIADAQLKASMR